jgi:hypothetical protein
MAAEAGERTMLDLLAAVLSIALLGGNACTGDPGRRDDTALEGDGGGDGATETDADRDSDTGAVCDPRPILPDCSGCPAVGTSLEHMRCAIDLCDDSVFISQDYSSPPPLMAETAGTFAALARFGSPKNDLAPLWPTAGGSYAVMATGPAVGTLHDGDMGGHVGPGDDYLKDAFADGVEAQVGILDAMEWRLHLKAPPTARGFQVHYVFMSVEYDEYLGTEFNDKFYIFLEAQSTNGGRRTVINFTDCRDDVDPEFLCTGQTPYCEPGTSYCYVTINSALSECCWYDGCPGGTATTDLTGTGFECGPASADTRSTSGNAYGSSTGWLVTQWLIDPGEEFDVIFHIHDTYDARWDSEVILDKFVFVENPPEPGTISGPVV